MTTKMIYITQGEDAVGADDDMVIATILGSCISICLWDGEARVGGMNHLLLPDMKQGEGGVDTMGAVAMERLINRLVRIGAQRARLRAKLFGGSSMLMGMTDIGARNAEFGRSYLAAEAIPCDSISVGGNLARKLRFWPTTGAVRQKYVDEAPTLAPPIQIAANDVELF